MSNDSTADDWHPELAAADDDEWPARGDRRRRMLRGVVFVALAAMVLPIVLSLYGVAYNAAARSCVAVARAFDAGSTGAHVAFDLFGPGGPGWLCYAESPHDSRLVANLGVIPGPPRFIDGPGRDI
ncbi:hypothetical protein FLP10_13950 [Agromyces intestinalis]|uniref:Uncharacterized protein n=1 Tax=Agromyces intestinalis TaxID=2592652 RepID=A0A5C1YJW3_9MICO|nr:hypothetical protein [Agromyces intestinalis]QEO15407.1 hypothetical protein FLP10_13950 [Agromyces intestinalis]